MANPYDMKESPNVGIIQRAGLVEQSILDGGWKDQLGKQFVDMAMQAQKEAAVERNRQAVEQSGIAKEGRAEQRQIDKEERGVLASTTEREKQLGYLEDEESPEYKAQDLKTRLTESQIIKNTKDTDKQGKMSDIDSKKYSRLAKESESALTTPTRLKQVWKEIYAIEDRYGMSTSTKPTGETVAELRARKAKEGGGVKPIKGTSGMEQASAYKASQVKPYERTVMGQKSSAINEIKDRIALLNNPNITAEGKAAIKKQIEETMVKHNISDEDLK